MKKNFILRRAFSRALALFIAIILSFHFSLAEKLWIALTSILVMQTAVGLALRQGIQRYITIAASVALGTFLVLIIQQPIIIDFLAAILFSVSCYFTSKNSTNYFSLSNPFLLGFILLLAMLLPAHESHILYARLYDVTLGATLGIVINLLIFPSRVDVEFRENVIPILHAYSAYLSAILDLFFKKEDSLKNLNDKKLLVENVLQTQSAFFPVWVYESGFTVALRQGHRHFLVMIERLGQILFSMNLTARQSIDLNVLQALHDPLVECVEQAKKIIQALTTVLNLKKLTEGVSDLSEEMNALEKAFKAAVPLSLELIDISSDYIYIAAFIQDLKGLRTVLIRLAASLRSS